MLRDGWMASLTQWTWLCASSGSWWWTGRPGVLQPRGSQRVRHDWATELNWAKLYSVWHQLSTHNQGFKGYKFAHMLSRSVMSDSLRSRGPYPARLLCLWDSPGKNPGVGCQFLLEGIFPTQGSNPRLLSLLPCKCIPYPLSHRGSPNLHTHKLVSFYTIGLKIECYLHQTLTKC